MENGTMARGKVARLSLLRKVQGSRFKVQSSRFG
jgi:hypothetical protein